MHPFVRFTWVVAALLVALPAPAGARPVHPERGGQAATAADLGVNLIINGDAEGGASATDTNGVVPPPGWAVIGNVTALQYGATATFPGVNDPGPSARGRAFLAGGPNDRISSAAQTVDLSGNAAAIEGGALRYTLSGWLGGSGTQQDHALLTVTFQDQYNVDLATASIGPVAPGDRSFVNGLVARTASSTVPRGARKAQVVLTFTRLEGAYNDGYADNLSLVLGAAPPPPAPVSQLVEPGGGDVSVAGGAGVAGGVTVHIPAGTFSVPTVVTVAVANEAPAGVAVSGGALLPKTIEVTTNTGAPLGSTTDLQVSLTSDEVAGIDLRAIKGGVVVGSTVDPRPTRVIDGTTRQLGITIDHFSKFTLFSITKPGPGAPSPPQGSLLDRFSVTLGWASPPGTTLYHLQNVPFNGDGPGVDIIRAAETSFTLPAPPEWFGLLPDMTYFWRVRTTTVSGSPAESDWSAWGSWTYRTPKVSADTIGPVSPADGGGVASLTPGLTWANSNPAVFYYEVQLSRDRSFNLDPATATTMVYTALVHGGVSTPPNTYAVPAAFPLEPGATYFWRVRPRVQGDGAPVAWPGPWTFQVP